MAEKRRRERAETVGRCEEEWGNKWSLLLSPQFLFTLGLNVNGRRKKEVVAEIGNNTHSFPSLFPRFKPLFSTGFFCSSPWEEGKGTQCELFIPRGVEERSFLAESSASSPRPLQTKCVSPAESSKRTGGKEKRKKNPFSLPAKFSFCSSSSCRK